MLILMPMPSNPSGFIFSRAIRGEVGSERDVRTIRFITIAGTETEARSTLSRFVHDQWNFKLTDEGPEVLRQAEELGIVEGDGKLI